MQQKDKLWTVTDEEELSTILTNTLQRFDAKRFSSYDRCKVWLRMELTNTHIRTQSAHRTAKTIEELNLNGSIKSMIVMEQVVINRGTHYPFTIDESLAENNSLFPEHDTIHPLLQSEMVASTWLGDHQGRPSTPVNHHFTAIDIWRVTSRVMTIIIIIIIITRVRQEGWHQRMFLHGRTSMRAAKDLTNRANLTGKPTSWEGSIIFNITCRIT